MDADKKAAAAAAIESLHDLPDELDSAQAHRLVDAADDIEEDVKETLSTATIKRAVGQFQLRIHKNEALRIQYPDEPERFLKSEVDLDDEIKRLRQLAVMPELLNDFLLLNGLQLLVSLLNHPNTDIAIEAALVLAEVTELDNLAESDNPEEFVAQLLTLCPAPLADTLIRIKEEESEDDYKGVTHILQIIDNLTELSPLEAASVLGSNTRLLLWLVQKVRHGSLARAKQRTTEQHQFTLDINRTYAAEILDIILQNSPASRLTLGRRPDGSKRRDAIDGVDRLLRTISVYRKKDPSSSAEQEFVSNLFNALSSLNLVESNQTIFGKAQGLELMIRMLRERSFSFPLALKLTSFALQNHPVNCAIFVEKWGLKPLCGVLMMKGVAFKKASVQRKEAEEHVVTILNSLVVNCTGTPLARVVNKFVENGGEKLERILEMAAESSERLKSAILRKKGNAALVAEIDKELDVVDTEEDYLYRCENGLSIIQGVGLTILALLDMSNMMLTSKIWHMLKVKGTDLTELRATVEEYSEKIDQEKGAGEIGRVSRNLKTFEEILEETKTVTATMPHEQ
eukprot:Lankesteria_metandrocarpae@DN5185_c0_g1_i1.p1